MNGSDGARPRSGQRPRHEAGAGGRHDLPVAAWENMRRIRTVIGMGEMVRVVSTPGTADCIADCTGDCTGDCRDCAADCTADCAPNARECARTVERHACEKAGEA